MFVVQRRSETEIAAALNAEGLMTDLAGHGREAWSTKS
jgi:hypothetical protein